VSVTTTATKISYEYKPDTLYSLPFDYQSAEDVKVSYKDANDVEVLLNYGTDYTVENLMVTVNASLPEGTILKFYRQTGIVQPTVFPPQVLTQAYEVAIDRNTMCIQEIKTDFGELREEVEEFEEKTTERIEKFEDAAEEVISKAQESADAAKKSETAAAESAGSAKEDAEKAEDAAERAEDILLRFESGTITKEFTASDSRWTENNGMWRLTMAMGNSRLIGVYKEVKKPQYEMVLTGVYMDAVNVIIEVPERFAGIVILASLTKKTGDKVYIKNFTEEDFTEVGSDYVLTISAEEHQAGSRPIIVSLTKIIDGVSYPYYANTGVDNNGNVVINVSEAFTGKIILDGGYLQ
jgi:hypothetical protein